MPSMITIRRHTGEPLGHPNPSVASIPLARPGAVLGKPEPYAGRGAAGSGAAVQTAFKRFIGGVVGVRRTARKSVLCLGDLHAGPPIPISSKVGLPNWCLQPIGL